MIDVYLNGIRQIPGVDYTTTQRTLSFLMTPPAGTHINIQNGRIDIANILADGKTFNYPAMLDTEKQDRLMNTLNDALLYQDNPAVADMLDRLSVVVNLVKQDVRSRA